MKEGRTLGKPFTHYTAVWAQDGIKQHFDVDNYTDESKIKSSVQVINGEVMKWGSKPDFMKGSIDSIEKFQYFEVYPINLSFRPFEGKTLLSELLVPDYATIYSKGEKIEGEPVYVVDIKRPIEPSYYGRVWIDQTRGVPLKFEYYDTDPKADEARLRLRVDAIQPYELPNGGWITIEGRKTFIFQEGGGN
jgi:hypothetical protein